MVLVARLDAHETDWIDRLSWPVAACADFYAQRGIYAQTARLMHARVLPRQQKI
jgi:hypothetical protein